MSRFRYAATAALLLSLAAGVTQAQWREHPGQSGMALGEEDGDGAEFTFARLIYGNGAMGRGWGRRGSWTTDMESAEHFFMRGITRLTRIDGAPASLGNARGAVQIDLLDGTVFDYPWLYAVEVGRWALTREEIEVLREYLLRGGFLMVDDFHGSQEWAGFIAVMSRVFPDRPIIDIPEDDEVFHVLYELDQRIQIPGIQSVYSGRAWEQDGYEPHWRGIYDDKGRLMVAINHNMDLGDAWEHADTPEYPQPMTALAYRFAVNYVVYALTH